MVYVIVYLATSYALTSAAALMTLRTARSKRGAPVRRETAAGVLLVACLLPLSPYGVVEVQTAFLAPSLREPTRTAMRDIGFADKIINLKVLSARPAYAKVYVVTPCFESKGQYRACTIVLTKDSGRWRFKPGSDEIVWSDCGSADGNVFPPYASSGDY